MIICSDKGDFNAGLDKGWVSFDAAVVHGRLPWYQVLRFDEPHMESASMHLSQWFRSCVLVLFLVIVLPAVGQQRDAGADWADFNHYVKIARADLANAAATALMKGVGDDELLAVVEGSDYRDYELTLERAVRVEALKTTAKALAKRIQAAKVARSREPERIAADIRRLSEGQRANMNAIARLKAAGQFSAPQLLTTLQNDKETRQHPWVMAAMVAIGRPLVGPLSEAIGDLESVTMGQVAQVLLQIGYPEALPALLHVLESGSIDPAAERTVKAAYEKLAQAAELPNDLGAADLYLALGRRYYEAATVDPAGVPGIDASSGNGVVWEHSRDAGLIPVPVPGPVYGDVLAMRAVRSALAVNPGSDEALTLWLAANLRRENRLPSGQTDPSYDKNMHAPSYYLLMAGPTRQHDVLARALDDRDTELALDAIEALSISAGPRTLIAGESDTQPLLRALEYPDRRVRFAAAFAISNANPYEDFPGSHRVVPVLTEAVRHGGQRYAVVLGADDDSRNSLTNEVTGLGYTVIQGAELADVSSQIGAAPGVDLIVLDDGLDVIDELARHNVSDPSLSTVPVVAILTPAQQIEVRRRMSGNSWMERAVVPADIEGLQSAVAEAADRFRGASLTDRDELNFTVAALQQLLAIGTGNAGIFDLQQAIPALIQALSDRRPSVTEHAAKVLAQINHDAAQGAIAGAALDIARVATQRTSLLESLAPSAANFGNRLSAEQVEQIHELVRSSRGELAIAAAKAHGALTLPTSNVVELVTE